MHNSAIDDRTLPLHPTMRHPLTGEPLRALGVMPKSGRIVWPIMGGSGEGGSGGDGGDGGQGGSGGGAGGDGGSGGRQGGSAGGQGDRAYAVDGQGNSLGFPAATPIAEMNQTEQLAYWRYQARKHENQVRDLTGGRPFEDVKNDLTAYAEHQRAQQTPAEQALAEATEKGRKEGIATERRNTATTLFRGALESAGITGDDLNDLVSGFNVDSFLTTEGQVDTTKITNFAKRFSPADMGGKQKRDQRRDFGAGRRGSTANDGGSSQAQEQAKKRGLIKSS